MGIQSYMVTYCSYFRWNYFNNFHIIIVYLNRRKMGKVLIIVDPQNDFISGSLAVDGAEEKIRSLANYLNDCPGLFDKIYVTMDTHPTNHCSFIENGGIWPSHCVQNTSGWDIPEYLDKVLFDFDTNFYKKGTDPYKEEYSIFENENDGSYLKIDLVEDLKESTEVYVCGIAGDYCVLETLKGLVRFSDNITVLNDYTASIDGGEKLKNWIEKQTIVDLI